jgi:diguanylate cyclase (GGDEF)-like protein
MAKGKVRLVKSAGNPAGLHERLPASARAKRDEIVALPSNKPAARSAAMRLAGEVERLQAELAAARAKVTQLQAQADVDPLLDMINRRGFDRELRRSLAYVGRYGTLAALIYLDLDRFKPVNDRYGHAVGDAVLQAVAATLRRAVRTSDVVARLGGDEFAVLLWNVTEAQAAAKAAGLEAAIAETRVLAGGVPLSVGASAGITMLAPPDAPAEVIARADLAMYARKRERNGGFS